MNQRSCEIVIRLTALFLLTSGVVFMAHAAISHRRYRMMIDLSLAQLEELQRLESALAAAYYPVAEWERIANEPPPLRALIRELALDREVVVREQSAQPMAITGWTLRRKELVADSITPADLWRLIDRAQTSGHPWRLRDARFAVTADDPLAMDGRLRFETLTLQ